MLTTTQKNTVKALCQDLKAKANAPAAELAAEMERDQLIADMKEQIEGKDFPAEEADKIRAQLDAANVDYFERPGDAVETSAFSIFGFNKD